MFFFVFSDKDTIFEETLERESIWKTYTDISTATSAGFRSNYRVLLEADNDSLPLYERINFIAIYSSNLEEFYKVRVAEHKAVASGGKSDGMSVDEARRLIHEI